MTPSRRNVSRIGRLVPLALGLTMPCGLMAQDDGGFARQREDLVDAISSPVLGERAIRDTAVLRSMRSVPRHLFVPPELESEAYQDRPLPIGYGQTISQPYIVGLMTELLEVDSGDRALEIGTGSGYQAAVLAEIVSDVYTIEIIEPLAESARQRLGRLGYGNVSAKHGDGYFGWAEHGPFDAIIVTAAASHIPPPLIEQLRPGGKMAIPVGPPLQVQTLLLVEKRPDGTVVQRSIAPVRFVPFTRAE